MSAKELKLTIPGYSLTRWGIQRRRDVGLPTQPRLGLSPGLDPVGTPVPYVRTPFWKTRIDKDRLEKNSLHGRILSMGWFSPAMDQLIRDIRECVLLGIPFKSTNTELVISDEWGTLGLDYLFAKGSKVATVSSSTTMRFFKVRSFIIPKDYHKYQLYLLRNIGIKVNKVGRKFFWTAEDGSITQLQQGFEYEVTYQTDPDTLVPIPYLVQPPQSL